MVRTCHSAVAAWLSCVRPCKECEKAELQNQSMVVTSGNGLQLDSLKGTNHVSTYGVYSWANRGNGRPWAHWLCDWAHGGGWSHWGAGSGG